MSVKIQAEKRLARERRCREALEQEILKYREYCTAQENEIEALQGLLRKHGISFDRVERPVVGSTIDVIAEVNDLSEKVKMMDQDDFSHPTAWAPHCAMAGGTSSLWASPERRHVQQWLIVTGLVCKISANDKQACCTQNVLEAAKLILSSIMQTIPHVSRILICWKRLQLGCLEQQFRVLFFKFVGETNWPLWGKQTVGFAVLDFWGRQTGASLQNKCGYFFHLARSECGFSANQIKKARRSHWFK